MARVVISLLLVWHFSAVFLAALSIQPTSMLVMDVAQRPPVRWYLDLLYLNHQHSFFAPGVGPGHVLHYRLFDASGREIERVELPNTKDYWPRLRYHRHLMLADQANLPSPDRELSQQWQRRYLEAYARHLLRTNPEAQSVRIARFAHHPLPREFAQAVGREPGWLKRGYELMRQQAAREGVLLDLDEEGYELLAEVTLHRRDIEPLPDQSRAGQGGRIDAAGRWMGGPR